MNLTSIVLLAVSAVAPIDSGKTLFGKITNYGVVGARAQPTAILRDEVSPSGERREYRFSDMTFVNKTDRIKIEKGTAFGLSYEFHNVPSDGRVMFELRVTHPVMQRPDGTVSKQETYKKPILVTNGFGYGGTSYRLKYDYELLPGEWKFEYRYQGNVILTKSFILYR